VIAPVTATNQPEIIGFAGDTTLLWPCRPGDFILWMRCSDILSGSGSIHIKDFWGMRDGYHVTITNRPEDFPAWFELHPTEVCNALVLKMEAKVKEGRYPSEPLDGPNLWRLRSGDRIAWVGGDRPGRTSVDGILAIVAFHRCAVAIGEGQFGGLQEFVGFGAPTTHPMSSEDVARCQTAVRIVEQLGIPRTWTSEWRIG
jgi:hypothetical protein